MDLEQMRQAVTTREGKMGRSDCQTELSRAVAVICQELMIPYIVTTRDAAIDPPLPCRELCSDEAIV